MPAFLTAASGHRLLGALAVLIICYVFPARAEDRLVGVVIDFQPRKVEGRPAVMLTHNGEPHRVREHDLIYEGDQITFDPAAPSTAYMKALVDHEKTITLDPAHPDVPQQSWPFLQSLVPKLLVAYRWINSAKGADDGEVRNALSRDTGGEVEDLSVLPHAGPALAISQTGTEPLWIAWTGGIAPFTVSLAAAGQPPSDVKVCGDGVEKTCKREAAVAVPAGDQPFTLTVKSSDGAAWTKKVDRVAIAWEGELADVGKLGELGIFLRATELLDRNSGEYVLESARELAGIAPDYPPARTLLNRIQAGSLP